MGRKYAHLAAGVTFLLITILVVDIVFILAMDDDEEERRQRAVLAAVEVVKSYRESRKRKHRDENGGENDGGRRKKKYIRYDRERANECVQKDYLNPYPTFDDRQFERIFRITRGMYERIRTTCCESDAFFTAGVDCTGRHAIYTDVKILAALKKMAYGVSGNAFRDYFQMGESTIELCAEKVAKAISHCQELRDKYLRTYSAADARRVSALHERVHGVVGMLGSLDCMHVPWKNCPVLLQGQYVNGKEGHPTIILEAVADYNLWFWHVAFGLPGSMNDINVWDRSELLKAMINGYMSSIDFEFEIGGKSFSKLWFLVDGIYPTLSRFVQTITFPVGRMYKRFCGWQEAARKDIERAFGVLQAKFRIVRHPVEKWYVEDIQEVVTTCVILHNMMVEKRINEGETEHVGMYEIADADIPEAAAMPVVRDAAQEQVENEEREVEHRMEVVEAHRSIGHAISDTYAKERFRHILLMPQRLRVVLRRWQNLYDKEEHFRLQRAIASELDQNRP